MVAPLVAGLLASVVLGGCSSDEQPAATRSEGVDLTAPQSGGRLPDAELAALSGPDSLVPAQLRGPAVVNVWASWCPPCREELPIYQEFAEAYADRVDVVGIDSEETDPGRARELVADTGVTYPNYVDPDGVFRAVAMPKVLLVDETGEVAFEQYLEITSVDQLETLVDEHLGVRP